MKKILNQSMKDITMKDFLNCFDVLQKLFFKKRIKKQFDENFFLENEKIKNFRKIDISEFVHRFYTVEISKAIVSLIEQSIKTLLNSDVKICMMIFEILNRCNRSMRNNSKLHVINVIDDKVFFEKMCENAKINLKNIIVRIFIFVIKNDDHDFIFETSYKRKTMFSLKYFVDKSCKIIIYSQCDIKRIQFQTIAFNHKSNKTMNFIFSQKFLIKRKTFTRKMCLILLSTLKKWYQSFLLICLIILILCNFSNVLIC